MRSIIVLTFDVSCNCSCVFMNSVGYYKGNAEHGQELGMRAYVSARRNHLSRTVIVASTPPATQPAKSECKGRS